MTGEQTLDIITYNKNALNNLRRAIVLGQGQFSLILARANYQQLREVLIAELSDPLRLDITYLPPETTSLRAAILAGQSTMKSVGDAQALMVSGLENIGDLERLLKSANLGRDELPKAFSYPVVLWVTDTVLSQLNRYAPDLKSFAATPIKFEYPLRSLTAALTEQANATFTQVLNRHQSLTFHDNLPLSGQIAGRMASQEFAFALEELETHRIDERLLADLLFLQGRNLHQQGDLERARGYYENSLLYWQQQQQKEKARGIEERERHSSEPTSLERQAILYFHLGLWWKTNAVGDRHAALAKAREYFEQALAIFRQHGTRDRTAKFLLPLADVLQKLEDWPALQQLAQEGIRLHHNDLPRLARDYGYLAEVAIAQYQEKPIDQYLDEARGFAQQALDIARQAVRALHGKPTEIAEATTLRYHAGCYLYWLAIAQQLQGQSESAIQNLEKAKIYVHPSYDLTLNLNILKRLRTLYFNRKQYARAFEVKLFQRRTESLFGLRAFIGAGQIQPPSDSSPFLPLSHPSLPKPQTEANREILAAEIRSSGRAADIEAIASRLGQPRYTLVVIHGQSGVGKSSTLKAGLIPKLQTLTSEGRAILPVWVDSYSNWAEQIDRDVTRRIQENLTLVDFSIEIQEPADSPAFEQLAAEGSDLTAEGLDNAAIALEPANVLQRLQALTAQTYQQIVLIFDQFEDFFHKNPTLEQRRALYTFLRDCLDSPYLKVVLSLREDFLHYLLEWDRSVDLSIVNNDVLSKEIRYYLGNFTPAEAKALIRQLTQTTGFILEDDLIAALVSDLAATSGEVRPIELQVVGAQIQRENITTLAQYQALGQSAIGETALKPKNQLLENFIGHVIQDCGPENANVASAILYILSDGLNESSDRPLKSHLEIEEALAAADLAPSDRQIQLVLDILIGSGLVFERLEISGVRYQLVHEYLSDLIQQQQQPGLIAALQAERSRRQLTEKQLEEALSAQNDTTRQTILAKQAAQTAEIKAMVSVARSLLLSGQSLEALSLATRAAKQIVDAAVQSNYLLKMQTALCLDAAIRSIREKNELVGHRNWVVAVDCKSTESGEIIVSGSDDSTVKLWTDKGEVIRSLDHPSGVADVRFSPDGTLLASACLDHTIRIYTAKGDFIRAIETPLASVTSLAFSPTEPLLAATYSDTLVRLWNLDGTLRRTLEGHEDWTRAIAFSPDGQTIATGGEDRTVRLWKITGEPICILKGHQGWVRSIAFSPDGNMLASAGDASTIRLWSREGRKLKTLYGHEDWIRSVTFSPDGQRIASGSDDCTIRIWSVGGIVEQIFNQRSSVHSVAWRADSLSVVSGGDDDRVHLWQLEGPPEPVCQAHTSIVWSARWHPTAEKILSASGDNMLKIWDEKGNLLQSIGGHEKGTHSAEWSPDGLFFASASADYSVRIWNADGEFVRSLIGHGDSVWQVCYDPSGKILASVSSDHTLRLWTANGNPIKTYSDHTDTIWHVDFSPDGQHLITASEDNTLRLWHVEKGLLQTIVAHEGGVWCAAFSPEGDFVASGGEDGDVRLWTVTHNQETLQLDRDPIIFRGHRDWVRSLSFSPSGHFIASASDDDTVRLWSITPETLAKQNAEESGESQLLPPLTGHKDVIWDVDFDQTGERIVSAGADGTMRVWDLRLETLIEKSCRWLDDWLIARPELARQIHSKGS